MCLVRSVGAGSGAGSCSSIGILSFIGNVLLLKLLRSFPGFNV